MYNTEQLKAIAKLLNNEPLTAAEHLSLQSVTAYHLKKQAYKDFKQHMTEQLQQSDAGETATENFYSCPWTISFAGKTVTIDNQAPVFNAIDDMLTELIDEL